MIELWNNLASRKVVLRARSACLVRCKFFFVESLTSESKLIGFNDSIFLLNSFKSKPIKFKISIALPSPFLISPKIRCSVPIKS